jgi:hypothetical protein
MQTRARAFSSSSTVSLSGTDIVAHRQHLETEDVKVHPLDFENLAMAPTPAATQLRSSEGKRCEDGSESRRKSILWLGI